MILRIFILVNKMLCIKQTGIKRSVLAGTFFFCLLIAFGSFAQSPYKSRLGRFQVDQKRGCAPFTVTITNTNLITTGQCTGTNPCNMDQGITGQAQQQNQFTFTYTTAGTYKLTVIYQSIGSDDITITVDDNLQPPFDIYSCSGNKVSVKVNDNKYQQYVIDFTDGSAETALPFSNNIALQHSYAAGGNKTVKVRGRNVNAADNCTAKVQTFTAVNALPIPSLTALTAIDASSLKLDFPVQSRIQLKSEIAVNNATTFQQYQSLYEVATATAASLKVDDNYYCFRLNNYDPCANANNYSPIMCSQNLDLSIQSGVDKLTWATATTGITSVTVLRNKQTSATLPGTQLFYDDTNVICKTNYCYTIVSNYAGGKKSTSLEKCGDAFTTSTPPAIDNISSTVIDPGVDLTWQVDPKVVKPEFSIFRSIFRLPYQKVNTVTTNKYSDPDYITPDIYCYRIDYADACGNASPAGLPFCPMRLSGELDNSNVTTLTWSKYNGWANGVSSYVVEKYNQSGALITSVNVGTDTTYVDEPPDTKNQLIRYVVKAIANTTGLTASVSNKVEIVKKTNLFAPTAFTPNSDKLNDTFSVGGQYIAKLNLKIFDRWGALVFTSDKNEQWSGINSNGQPMPAGSYVWKAEVVNMAGQNFSHEGTVLLIRNK